MSQKYYKYENTKITKGNSKFVVTAEGKKNLEADLKLKANCTFLHECDKDGNALKKEPSKAELARKQYDEAMAEGNALLKKKDFEGAEQAFLRALEAAPGEKAAVDKLAEAKAGKGGK